MSRAARRRAASALAPGQTIAGRYRLEAKLGEGGMAEVFRADDLASGRKVAVKVLHADVAANPEAVERTKREGQVLSELDNPAIVSVETFGELDDGGVFLVMELLEGETLGERIRRGPLDPVELAPVVAGTCAGLHAAHARGIVHRDLKPDNIFLCPTEHGLQVKLLDFGISKVYGSQKLTQTGEILGTPRYMSPEQLGAEPDVDARADVYALGVILYEALAGKPPFLASTPTDLVIAILNGKVAPLRTARPELSEAVEAVVMRALSKVRAARFDTAMELAEAYIDAVGGVKAVRSQQRRGMATRAFGGMVTGPAAPPPPDALPDTRPPPASAASDAVAGNLRIGTFSGFAERAPEPAKAPPAKGDKRTAAMGASPGAAIPEAPGAPVPARMVDAEDDDEPVGTAKTRRAIPVTRSPEEEAAAAAASPSVPITRHSPMEVPSVPAASSESSEPPKRRVAPTAMMDPSQVSVPGVSSIPSAGVTGGVPPVRAAGRPRPSKAGRVLLVVGALLAGAASAGAVIGVLHYLEEDEAPASDGVPATSTPDEAPRGDAADPPTAVPAPEGAEAPDEAAAAATPEADGDPAETEPAEEEDVTRAPDRRRRSASRRRGSREERDRREEPREDATPSSPFEAIQMARAAQRAGDADRCIALLDEAIRSGAPPIALRYRGDCYEAAGRRTDAVRDYQRFCRLAHDNPAITEVRPLLESWGRSCP